MYSTLDKLDLTYRDGDRTVGVQTDHRGPAEIEAEWDVSVIFGAVRARAALLGGKVQAVTFAFPELPPPRMVLLLQQLGAQVQVGGPSAPALPAAPDAGAANRTVEAAFLHLGEATFAEHNLPTDLEGLERLEEAMQADTEGGPDSEFAHEYWTHVVTLGGAAAVVMKDLHGGGLHADDEVAGPIPFRWAVGGSLVNLFGRAASFLDDDPNIAPSKLVAMQSEQAGPEGAVMFNLRPKDWPGISLALLVPLLERDEALEPHDLPLVALVTDYPTATKTFSKDTPPEEAERLTAEARGNLVDVEVQVREVNPGPTPMLVVHGHFYAAERLLDAGFMRELQARLNAELLLAGVPKKGVLMVQNAVQPVERVAAFHRVVRTQFDQAAPSDKLSTAVLLVKDGALVGLSRLDETPPQLGQPAKKKGFWARLFGGGGSDAS